MRINDDLSKPVIVHASKLDWVASPSAGVDRRMLFRVGGEVARATSIVRYAPGSAFPRHTHGGGEEIVVLEGTFQDEHGDYPAGSYFRNPPGTSHVPASKDGCTIFVRLWQFRDEDRTQVVRQPGEGQQVAPRPGASSVSILFKDGDEEVRLEDWRPGEIISLANARGLEFFVLSGGLTIGGETLQPQGWGRLPAGVDLKATVGPQGAKIWIKEAPLLHPDVCRLPG
ncbi:cupin domain-containing protein [Bradyrhizobium brasilense]|uniref:Anti-sigma factor ChrR, cupin superfamily n=1 Tax=Bradyrhizobium brasilense TaxID=1419277 RepID=A0A1G6ZT36_9BRAD|nr:cupin domain-containing protein [Bradyrhizobium brasilense]MCC8971293.1 cupin domain-containing protein [Bradyrhizobium brasilense]SDE05700.1 Anti-sigma factor ChrR, cupin superfamily [Bradyrhizobium brasilense]